MTEKQKIKRNNKKDIQTSTNPDHSQFNRVPNIYMCNSFRISACFVSHRAGLLLSAISNVI